MKGYVTKSGEEVTWDENDPASLEAWFGNYGHSEAFRKVVLASCREQERARAVVRGEKLSEARLDDLARTSDAYVDYLIATLKQGATAQQNQSLKLWSKAYGASSYTLVGTHTTDGSGMVTFRS